jgi:hypothetical protein
MTGGVRAAYSVLCRGEDKSSIQKILIPVFGFGSPYMALKPESMVAGTGETELTLNNGGDLFHFTPVLHGAAAQASWQSEAREPRFFEKN